MFIYNPSNSQVCMPKDATPEEIILVNKNFANDRHDQIANNLLNEWDGNQTIKDIAELDDEHSRSLYNKVYKRYMGVGQSQFGDGIRDERSIEDLKKEFGSLKTYIEMRKHGKLDIEAEPTDDEDELVVGDLDVNVTEIQQADVMEILMLLNEQYRKGYQKGQCDAKKAE